MAEKMVRCHRCHEVFDAEAGPCTKCGAPYQPPAAPPEGDGQLYVDRYAGTEFVPPPLVVPLRPLPRRNSTGLLIGGGVVLIGLAAVVAIIVAVGGLGSAATAPPGYVVPRTEQPSATPTLPPSVALTLQQLNDPNLSADVTVQSVADVNDPSLGKHERHSVSFVGQIAGGNEGGIVIEEGITREYRIVDGVVFVRVPPATRWSTAASIAGYLVIDQSFGLTKPQMLRARRGGDHRRAAREPLPEHQVVGAGRHPNLHDQYLRVRLQTGGRGARPVDFARRQPGEGGLLGDQHGRERNEAARYRDELHVHERRRSTGDRESGASPSAISESLAEHVGPDTAGTGGYRAESADRSARAARSAFHSGGGPAAGSGGPWYPGRPARGVAMSWVMPGSPSSIERCGTPSATSEATASSPCRPRSAPRRGLESGRHEDRETGLIPVGGPEDLIGGGAVSLDEGSDGLRIDPGVPKRPHQCPRRSRPRQ